MPLQLFAGSMKGQAVSPEPSLLYARCMDSWKFFRCAAVLIAVATVAAPAFGQKQTPADYPTQFLEKLRERGWHDVALDYLERADEDPLATPEFLTDRDYHMAVTQTALARQAIGEKERQSQLAEAVKGFHKFSTEHPESSHYFAALSQVGNMLAEQALAILNKADRLPAAATSEQESLRASAREILNQASVAVEELLTSVDERLAKLPRGAALQANKADGELKLDLQAKQAEGRFLSANLNFEKSRTYRKDSPEYKDTLETAAAGFARLRKEYENKLVGFYAVLYEGRCYQNAGDLKKALKTYGELVNQPVGQADFRKLIARALRYRAECYMASDDFEKVIEECGEWLDQSRGEELSQPEWLAVAFRLAEAYSGQAASDAGAGSVSRLRTEARKLYREVSRQPGEFQDEARAALALSAGSDDIQQVEVKGFADAFAAGKSALEQMSSLQLATKLAANNNPEGVEELQEQVTSNRTAALNYFQTAIKLIDDKAPADDAVAARYFLCWLYWEDGRTEEAAKLGEQIAKDFPDSQYAPTAAKVTLAAYERLYLEARKSNAAAAEAWATKLRDIAELIVARWNESEAATTATNLLISLALQNNEFGEADRLLAQLPEKSRGAAGLSLGASLWSQYLQQTAGKEGPPDDAALELKSRSAKLLAAGYKSLADAQDLPAPQAAAVLYYVQVLLADGDAEQALEVLKNKQIGPLAVMQRSGTEKADQAFALETCKAALRTYLSVDPPRNDDAIAMMEKLEAISAGSGTTQNQITGIYVNLGLQLQEQIKQLTSSGNKAKAKTVAAAFSSLLQRVAERGDSQSWAVRNWLAQTSLQLGSGLSGAERDRYLAQAEKAYRDILATVKKDPKFAPNELAILAVRKKLGESLEARGNYDEAIEQYTAILKAKPNMLELQQVSAAALQAWGVASRDVKVLEQAIRGMNPQANTRNLVWGWLQLATVAEGAKRAEEQSGDKKAAAKYEEIYFTARFQAAKARLAAAKLASGDSQTKQLAIVRQSITTLKQLYPNLNSGWKTQFDALLKEAGG